MRQRGERLLRPREDAFALGRQPHETPSTLDDHDAEFFFQTSYRRGQGGLRYVTRFGRLGEMFFAGQSDQVIELPDEHLIILPQIAGILPK